MELDWPRLAEEFGCGESGGTDLAQRALDWILGEEMIRGTVDHYVDGRGPGTGSELARSFLIHVRSPVAMDYCYRIYKEDADIERRRGALELLRMISERRTLPWVREFLDDPDPEIQGYGASMLDQLLFARMIDKSECAGLLAIMRDHANESVRRYHSLIMDFLGDKAS
jgi:hypothetical protein